MYFDIITGAVVFVAFFTISVFTSESEISSMCLLVELGGFLILLIKLILGVLILILFLVSPNPHSRPFSLPPSLFL